MLLTLDISTTATGYCVGAPGSRPRFGAFKPGNLDRTQRIYFMACSVVHAVKTTGADQVVAEAVSVGSWTNKNGKAGAGNFMNAGALNQAHGAISNELWRVCKLRMETMNLATARSQLGIRKAPGQTWKQAVISWCRAQGYAVQDDNAADALAIWLAVVMGKTGTTISQPGLKLKGTK